eukprot:TRINITY_DN7140_c1_g2_i2.p1 TRINITY_DN7140_c1_g2~~TRINITY_DN7140_c1_g2_i2.p1  ORF type:complete len:627 (-),score=121.39 TRINITY_DN7140_c1_g2_i2:94-1974(-)
MAKRFNVQITKLPEGEKLQLKVQPKTTCIKLKEQVCTTINADPTNYNLGLTLDDSLFDFAFLEDSHDTIHACMSHNQPVRLLMYPNKTARSKLVRRHSAEGINSSNSQRHLTMDRKPSFDKSYSLPVDFKTQPRKNSAHHKEELSESPKDRRSSSSEESKSKEKEKAKSRFSFKPKAKHSPRSEDDEVLHEDLIVLAPSPLFTAKLSRRNLIIKSNVESNELEEQAKSFSGRLYSLEDVGRSSSFSNLSLPRDSLPAVLQDMRPLMKHCKGYWIEAGNPNVRHDQLVNAYKSGKLQLEIENSANDIAWYQTYFSQNDHTNYIGRDKYGGPFVLSIVKKSTTDNSIIKVLLRTKKEDKRESIVDTKFNKKKGPTPEEILKIVAPTFVNIRKNSLKENKSKAFIQHLINYEQNHMITNYKFGILLCKEGQVNEREMFSNEHPTPEFEDFLRTMGTKIKLRNWTTYSGGLDTSPKCSTGKHAIYTEWRNYCIMFHVSTMLPFSIDNPQQLSRKQHLGNDIVLIIFKEGNTPYSPTTVASTFNHVIIVVQPVKISGATHYRISVASKDTVPSFGPELPEPSVFRQGPMLREYLLTKMINGERAAYRSSKLSQKLLETRLGLLSNIEKLYS